MTRGDDLRRTRGGTVCLPLLVAAARAGSAYIVGCLVDFVSEMDVGGVSEHGGLREDDGVDLVQDRRRGMRDDIGLFSTEGRATLGEASRVARGGWTLFEESDGHREDDEADAPESCRGRCGVVLSAKSSLADTSKPPSMVSATDAAESWHELAV